MLLTTNSMVFGQPFRNTYFVSGTPLVLAVGLERDKALSLDGSPSGEGDHMNIRCCSGWYMLRTECEGNEMNESSCLEKGEILDLEE